MEVACQSVMNVLLLTSVNKTDVAICCVTVKRKWNAICCPRLIEEQVGFKLHFALITLESTTRLLTHTRHI
jgi:hypothetical protein